MGPAFVILFWLILLGIYALLWGGSLVLFLVSLAQKRRWLKILASVPLCTLTLAALLLAGAVIVGIIQSMRPAFVFQQVFRQEPTAAITDIQSKYWTFADSGTIYLKFRCSLEDFQSLKPDRMQPLSYPEAEQILHAYRDVLPAWFDPPELRTLQRFACDTPRGARGRIFTSETELMLYDPATQTTFYFYSGID